ncbi:MAG: GNAT family N-acetyltransferase [Terriglobales bacterium]
MAVQAPNRVIQEHSRGEFLVSTDPARIDLSVVHRFLTNYWETEGIPAELVARAIEHSLCFGVYEGTKQVGFARVVTDCATFAYLCDDFVLEDYRGRGLARFLMECIQAHPGLQGLRRWFLGPTRDRRLYEKFGFKPLADPGQYMEIVRLGMYKQSGR